MINDTEKLTLPVGILSIKQPFSTGDNVVFAAVVLAILPVLIDKIQTGSVSFSVSLIIINVVK